jgi:uncharacterized SAM-dependent methyltransferase
MNKSAVEEILKTIMELFPKETITQEAHDNDALEVHIKSNKRNASTINLAFDEDIFMQIDDFRFEYKGYVKAAQSEIERYLRAAAADDLIIEEKKILGITLSKRLTPK